MAALDRATLQALSDIIKNETVADANSATRIGQMFGALTESQSNQTDDGDLGRVGKYDILAGVIQKVGTSNWEFIDNEFHTKINLDAVSVVDQGVDVINITYGKTYSKVMSFVAIADEGMIQAGLLFGTSVGTSFTNIYIRAATASAFVESNGLTFSFPDSLSTGVESVVWDAASNSAKVTITNSYTKTMAYANTAISTDPAYRCIISFTAGTYINVQFVDNNGLVATSLDSNMNFIFTSNKPALKNASDDDFPPSSNIWLYGIMER